MSIGRIVSVARVALFAAFVLGCAPGSGAGQAPVDEPRVEGVGRHWRIESELGTVHAWEPDAYDATHAGVMIYVHGYGMPIDEIWSDDALAQQFAASGRNALFLAPEAPQSNKERVHFTTLNELFAIVREGGLDIPSGPLAVVGHSGGFRTILPWLQDRRLRELILLDGMYGRDTPFRAWLKTAKGQPAKKLVLVAADTARKSERLVRRYPTAVRRAGVPEDASLFTRRELTASILYLRSQYEHMQIVLSGRVLPVLLRLTSLSPVGVLTAGAADQRHSGE